MSRPRIYLAGPMTGIEDFNFPAFHAAAAEWRAAGWGVINPAESFDGATGLPYRTYVEHDVQLLKSANAIAMLPGWDEGKSGAIWEFYIARYLLGLPWFDARKPVQAPRARWAE